MTGHYPFPSVLVLLLALLCPLSLFLLPSVCGQRLDFVLQTLNAPWSARSTAQVELFRRSTSVTTVGGESLAIAPNSLILQGSTNTSAGANDVWLSSDRGRTWLLIAGVAGGVRAAAPYADSSFAPTSYGGFAVDPTTNDIYRVGGRVSGAQCSSAVWRSTDGKTWANQVDASSALYSPLRDEGIAVMDGRGRLYLLAGRRCSDSANLSDVWMSADRGRNWELQTNQPGWTPRVGPFVLALPQASGEDALLLFTGVDGGTPQKDCNDVWVSTNQGVRWQLMTMNAAFPSRNNVNAEVTENGLIVMTSGKHDHLDGRREYLNDVWVSADGGWTWGLCAEDAPFGDRRMPATVLDAAGRLLVMGGFDATRLFNDVWLSSLSFNSFSAVSAACNVRIPSCGPGLTCLPSDPTLTRQSDGSVYCAQLSACINAPTLRFSLRTLHAPWSPRAASQVELYTKPLTYTNADTGTTVRLTGNALIMQGSLNKENDVWVSSDHGRSWDLLSGQTKGGARAAAPFDEQSFAASDYGGFAMTADSIYRIGGRVTGGCSNAVWSSTDGKRWANAVTASSQTWTPLRDETVAVADAAGNLYYMGGRTCGDTSARLNDVWMSSDKGRSWKLQTAAAEWTGRVAAMVVAIKPRSTTRDALLLFGGVDLTSPPRDLADVWVSTTQGTSWVRMTDAADFPSRNNHNAEVTKAGLIVMTGGKHDHPDGRREYLNDVWLSADGGYTFGQCTHDAPFEDRRVPATVLDDTGRLLVMGGYDSDGVEYNDVWRTELSFDDFTAAARVCGVTIPACGPGLTCLPTDTSFSRQADGSVTCAALRTCQSKPMLPSSVQFRLQTLNAPWSPRSTMQVELYGKATSYKSVATGATVSVPANSLILQGNQNYRENDVWLSSDRGVSWNLIAGVSLNGSSGSVVRAASPFDQSSFPVPVPRYGGHVVDAAFNIFRIGGSQGSAQDCTDSVFMSTDGKTWVDRAASSTARFAPMRDETTAVADSKGALILMGGRRCPSREYLNDVWMSSDQGRTWRMQCTAAPWSGRYAPMALSTKSAAVGTDVIVFFAGQDSSAYRNDVWASTTLGRTWLFMTQTGRSSWHPRNFLNAEVTKAGLMVLTAGYNNDEYFNDVWVSGDGGWTWGRCAEDAAFSDRRIPATVIDSDGFLLVMGGYDVYRLPYNDVWRSAVSFTDLRTVAAVCGITIPACGPGISCLPGMSGYIKAVGRAPTCAALTACSSGGDGGDTSSSSGGALPAVPDSGSAGGLNGWVIGALIVLALATAAVGYYLYRRGRAEPGAGYGQGGRKEGQPSLSVGLLGDAADSSSSGTSNALELTKTDGEGLAHH